MSSHLDFHIRNDDLRRHGEEEEAPVTSKMFSSGGRESQCTSVTMLINHVALPNHQRHQFDHMGRPRASHASRAAPERCVPHDAAHRDTPHATDPGPVLKLLHGPARQQRHSCRRPYPPPATAKPRLLSRSIPPASAPCEGVSAKAKQRGNVAPKFARRGM